jgi:hypothetical protein
VGTTELQSSQVYRSLELGSSVVIVAKISNLQE